MTTIDSWHTFHGMGMIASVTPSLEINSTDLKDESCVVGRYGNNRRATELIVTTLFTLITQINEFILFYFDKLFYGWIFFSFVSL